MNARLRDAVLVACFLVSIGTLFESALYADNCDVNLCSLRQFFCKKQASGTCVGIIMRWDDCNACFEGGRCTPDFWVECQSSSSVQQWRPGEDCTQTCSVAQTAVGKYCECDICNQDENDEWENIGNQWLCVY